MRIVLTGVSRGLGRAMAELFIEQGHEVCGCARSEAAVAELSSKYASPSQFEVVDVSDDAAVETWALQVMGSGEAPDYLINNAAIINRNTARNILLTTYRHKIPVITFSAAYVRAGALAAVYSSADQIARQTAEMIGRSLSTGIYSLESAKYFSISINDSVAKALNIQTISEDVATKRLQKELEATNQ